MKKKTLVPGLMAAAALVFCGTAHAQQVYRAYDLTATPVGSPTPVTPAPRGPGSLVTGFEPSEGFLVGPVGGQMGWTTFNASTTEGHVDALNPMGGSQHLRIDHDPASPNGTSIGAFSPNLGALPVGPSSLTVDVAISAAGGADYDIVVQAPSQGFLSARVKFSWQGHILVLDNPGTGLSFVDTGVTWNVGTYTNLTINIDPVANTIDYSYGGTPIYSGVAGVFAGTTMEQVVLFSDNWNLTDVGDFDNVSMVPEPATLAMLGLGGLCLVRRRR
ncbi:MAG: PEP-CTERM sorting domain-containing protein [Phycisphaerae bacterium]